MPTRPRPAPRSQEGFSLVEAVIALALLGLALAFGLTALARGPRYRAEIAARQRALRSIEGALDGIRSGATPILPGTYPGEAFLAEGDDALRLTLAIEPADVAALYHVRVEAEYEVAGARRSLDVETLTWSP
jgi:prepilin-type N-terminal cleavage/methylation domain-containing protein